MKSVKSILKRISTDAEYRQKWANRLGMNLNEEGITVTQIVMLGVGIIVLAYTLPVAFDAFYAADTANWTIDGAEDTKATAMWYLLPFIVIIGVVIIYLKSGD